MIGNAQKTIGQDLNHDFYVYHSSYNRAELPQYQSKQNIMKNGATDGNHDENPPHEVYPLLNDGPMDSAWPMMSHDVYHTGRSPYNTTLSPEGVEIWRFDTSNSFDGGVVIDKEGNLFFGCMDGYVYSTYPNGTMKWKTNLYRNMDSTPAIDENGTIYIGTIWNSNCLFALYSNNGTLKWSHPTGDDIDSSPTIGVDGTIYFGCWNGCVYALHPDGRTKWIYHTGDIITGSPAIGPDGTVYIGSHDSILYALNPNATVKWKFDTGGWVRVSPCVGDDGTVYCVSFDNYLYAIYPNGTMKWKTFVNAGTNPTIGPDGTIYAGWDVLYAINPNGSVKWTFPGYAAIEGGSPCISKEGIIYFGTTGDKIVAVNPNGTLRWVRDLTHPCQSPPAIDSDGFIYIGSESPGAAIHAFGHSTLRAEANGPYNGVATIPLQFTGDIFGGYPPYICHWDFGDNQSSTEQNPKHTYAQGGNYNTTFTVADNQGNESMDTANAIIDYAPPSVTITKPTKGIYFKDAKVIPFFFPLIFGPITIEVDARQDHYGIHEVSFYVDDIWISTDLTYPYSCLWSSHSLRKHHTIYIQAEDNSQKLNWAHIDVWKFF
ncbi:MAG TPA: PQQ-binding-like beta-propeller repeat protein [Ignavibacteriaceae bacterium]|nr:PQQ-binding-like beta-propeller repeat protein [Ignavibacteriaceae bacterium]